MRVFALSSVSILAVFVLAAGFSLLREPVIASSDIEVDVLAIPTMIHDSQGLTSITPYLSIPTAIIVPVCILPGEPSKREKREFSRRLADSDCERWRKEEDDDNGNIAMIWTWTSSVTIWPS